MLLITIFVELCVVFMDPPPPTNKDSFMFTAQSSTQNIQNVRHVIYTTDCKITSTLINNSHRLINVLENKWRLRTSPMPNTDYTGVSSYRFSEKLYHRKPAFAGTSRGRLND
jgi:hypothetical protein